MKKENLKMEVKEILKEQKIKEKLEEIGVVDEGKIVSEEDLEQ